MTRTDRENLDRIKNKWESLKTTEGMSGSVLASAVALWASINVDYLIALAERGDHTPKEAG